MILIATVTLTGTYTGSKYKDKALQKEATYSRTIERLIKEGKLNQEDFEKVHAEEKKEVKQLYQIALKQQRDSECNMF